MHGWQPDPFQLHEERYFSQDRPTNLVKDGGVESYDDPPAVPSPPQGTPSAPPGRLDIRAEDDEDDRLAPPLYPPDSVVADHAPSTGGPGDVGTPWWLVATAGAAVVVGLVLGGLAAAYVFGHPMGGSSSHTAAGNHQPAPAGAGGRGQTAPSVPPSGSAAGGVTSGSSGGTGGGGSRGNPAGTGSGGSAPSSAGQGQGATPGSASPNGPPTAPGSSTPEAPTVLLLPVIALVVVGAALLRRRAGRRLPASR